MNPRHYLLLVIAVACIVVGTIGLRAALAFDDWTSAAPPRAAPVVTLPG